MLHRFVFPACTAGAWSDRCGRGRRGGGRGRGRGRGDDHLRYRQTRARSLPTRCTVREV